MSRGNIVSRMALVRSADDRPAVLLVVGKLGSYFDVTHQEAETPIGFPEDRVFRHDPQLVEALTDVYVSGRPQKLADLWKKAELYQLGG